MLEAVVGVVGVVVGVAGLVTSYAGHRHSVREAVRVAAMAREVEERERELAREAERQAEVVQASLVQVMMRSRPSPLTEQWVGWSLQATNGSNQPVRDIALHYDGRPLPTSLTGGLLHAGESVSALLPTSDTSDGPAHPSQPALGVVEFTDAAGVRWRRSAAGTLEQRYESGSWDARPPRVAPFQPPATQTGAYGRPAPAIPPGTGVSQQQPQQQLRPQPQLRSKSRSQKPLPPSVSAVMVLVGAGLVAWAVWSLTR
ncbi:hypothetical protein AB0H18_19920 [Streptomyces sp. NPDC020766]|uniref:hypothetical protein n=1 Tax=Streptomyces sp. NPDC020766 TaxID=3155011 RepID=UPI0033F9193B